MRSKGLLGWVNYLTGQEEVNSLELRIFNVITFIAALLNFGGGVAALFFQGANPVMIVLLFITGLVTGVVYFLGRFRERGQMLIFPTSVFLLIMTALYWFFNGGIYGQIPMAFYLLAVVSLGILPIRRHFLFICILGGVALVLVSLHFLYPDQIPRNPDKGQIYSDLVITFGIGIVLIGLLFRIIKANFEKERERVLQINEELSDFAHVVSHDMKAPLRGIQHLSNFVLEDYEDKLDPESQEMLRKVIHSADRMTGLINDILTYTRVSENVEEKQEIDLNELVKGIVTYLNPPSNVSIKYTGLPKKVYYNRIALHQVIQNLISNAIKYNDKDHPKIEISANQEGKFYWISVKDNGPGIAPEHHEKVFEFLKTLGNKSRNESGTGIGLALVKKIIEQNQGDVKIESKLGLGATFRVSIPV